MRKLITLATTTLLAATVALPAQAEPKRQDAPGTSASRSAALQADTKRYCVTDKIVGSRLPKKTCKTRAQWIADNDFDPLAPQR